MDVLHIVFLRMFIIDAHAMWYFFNQNIIILKSSFLEISGENRKFFQSFLLFSEFISQLETRGILSHPLLPSIASSRVKCGMQEFKDACGRQDVHLRSAGSPIHTQI